MAHNLEYTDPTLQVYEALAIVEEQSEEIERLRRENEELRRNQQGPAASPEMEGNLPQNPANIESSLSLNPQNNDSSLSFDLQVKTAIEAITQAVAGLRNTVQELAERVNDITRELNEKMDNVNDNVNNIHDRMDRDIEENRNKINGLHTNFEELTDRVDNINKSVKRQIRSINTNIGEIKHSIAVLHPQIILLGGIDDMCKMVSDIFLLDCVNNSSKALSINMPYNVAHHGSVIINDELYSVGGYNGKEEAQRSLQRLNKQMKWEERASMNEGRYGIGNSCVVYDNCIWVFGGIRKENGKRIYLNTVEIYDPNTNRWEMKPEMKITRTGAAAAVVKDKIYVCGGYDGTILDSIEVFDTTSEVWTDFCTMPEPRSSLCVAVEGTSIILIGGLLNKITQTTVWKMDVEDEHKKWIDLPSLNQARSYSSAVKIEGRSILIIGGCTFKNDKLDQVLKSVEVFDGQKWNVLFNLSKEQWGHTTCLLTRPLIDAFNKFLY